MNSRTSRELRAGGSPPASRPAARGGPRRPGRAIGRLALLGAAALGLAAPGRFVHVSAHEMSEPEPASATGPVRSIREYAVPSVRLVRADEKVVSLPDEMDDGRPVVLNFIFTTCGAICPVMSSVFEQFERRLGADAEKVHLMSISIDPEQDTPERLRDYARRFHAGRAWQHYTGTRAASIAAQRAFGVYGGDKMSHAPVTLLRAAPGEPWLRIDGLVTPDELEREYRRLLADTRPRP